MVRNAKTDEEKLDYGDFKDPPNENILGRLRKGALDLVAAQAAEAKLQERLIEATAVRVHLEEKVLPALMQEAQTDDWKGQEGTRVMIVEQLFANISEENRPKAHAWLEKHNLGDIVKRKFEIMFGKGDEAWAKKFANDLKKRKKKLNTKITATVHPSTLKATVKEILEEGELKLPLDLFGVHQKKVAKVEVPK